MLFHRSIQARPPAAVIPSAAKRCEGSAVFSVRKFNLLFSAGIAVCLLLAAAPSAFPVQDDITRRRQEYDRERDPVDKAKKLPKLGQAHLDAARRAIRDDNIPLAITLLQEHRDLIAATREALLEAVPNPEKKSGGFKQMEIHVRKSLDQMTDIIAEAPASDRAPFEAIRDDLARISRLLIRDLFPRQPGAGPPRSNP
jgi:hypothetical protein